MLHPETRNSILELIGKIKEKWRLFPVAKVYLDGIAYRQFGHEVFFTKLRLKTLLAIFEVDANVQRELDPQRKLEIRTFILNNVEQGCEFHFTPFLFSGRKQLQKDEQGYFLSPGAKLYTLDGQHRSYALEAAIIMLKSALNAIEFIKHEEKMAKLKAQIEQLENYPITLQIYLDLNEKQERQLFSDVNTERKEAHPGQLLQYDHRDAYSILTRELAQRLQKHIDIELYASRVVNSSSALTTLVMMKRCLVALFDGLYVQKAGEATFRYPQQEVEQIAEAFFLKWLEIFPKRAHRRTQYVTGLTGIQIALALTVHSLTKEQNLSHLEAIQLLSHLKKFSWRHTDPIFEFLYSDEKKYIVGHSSSHAIRRIKNEFMQIIKDEMMVKI